MNSMAFGNELLRLFMYRTLVIARTEFGVFDTARLRALILRRRIITHFAFGAFESDDITHC